ncbi:energy transducer TonB [Tepidiphilus baoligensis]|uniref:TonB C-terminal domain-containing protein n=1 Tax=Tepidiphilus baoligensis TaxID=2698687 RepID=A0ABX1QKF0_9PROT|nr:energy transducer TonB [Tepidiphilus baoligensis]NMH15654.1 hypothetical protein [Tepidiphilus baoligensis]
MREDSFGGKRRRAAGQWRFVLAAWVATFALHVLAYGLLALGFSSAWPPREPPPFAVSLIGPFTEEPTGVAGGEPVSGEQGRETAAAESPVQEPRRPPPAEPLAAVRSVEAPRARATAARPEQVPSPRIHAPRPEKQPAAALAGEEGEVSVQDPLEGDGAGGGGEIAGAKGEGAPTPPAGAMSGSSVGGGRKGKGDGEAGGGAPWAERLRAWLEAHKVYPPKARRLGVEGTVWVRLSCSDGKALVRLERSSGSPWLDDAALALVREGLAALEGDAAVCAHGELTVPIGYRLVG